MRARLTVSSEPGHFRHVQVEFPLEPVYGRRRVSGEHADEVVSCEGFCGFFGVVEEDLCGVWDAERVLRGCAGTVYTAGSALVGVSFGVLERGREGGESRRAGEGR
jgi:hypothetical protein